MKFVRAFEHRSMAVGLPYVLHGLVSNDLAEQCSISYLNWRMMIDNVLFCEGAMSDTSKVNGFGSVDELRLAGHDLQRLMNDLYRSNKGTQDDINGNYEMFC